MKFSRDQLIKNRMFVYKHYFIYNSPEDMQTALENKLGVELTDRTLRSYYRWAEKRMQREGVLKRESDELKRSIMTQLERLRRLAEQAARDEARARSMNVYRTETALDGSTRPIEIKDPATGQIKPVVNQDLIMRQDTLIKSATYRQLNIEKQILAIFEKTGAAVPREEHVHSLSQELTLLLVQANIAIAYQFIPRDKRNEYVEAASALEEAKVEDLERIVSGDENENEKTENGKG